MAQNSAQDPVFQTLACNSDVFVTQVLLYLVSSINLRTCDLNQNTVEQGARELIFHSLVCYFKSKIDSSNNCGAGGVGNQPRENSISMALVCRLLGAEIQYVGLSNQGVWGREIKQVVNRKAGSVSGKKLSGESLGAVAWPGSI